MERDASDPPTYSRGERREGNSVVVTLGSTHGFHTRARRTGRLAVSYVLIEARFDVLWWLEPIFQR